MYIFEISFVILLFIFLRFTLVLISSILVRATSYISQQTIIIQQYTQPLLRYHLFPNTHTLMFGLNPITRAFSKSKNFFFNKQEINPSVLAAEYAVRGVVPSRAADIQNKINSNKSGHGFPFDEITYCNIGNPQYFHQKPISYNRRVLSCLLNPELLKSNEIHKDVKNRAKFYLDNIISAGSYTASLGIDVVRQSVARYIEKNDQVERPNIDNIFLTEGASQGVHMILQVLLSSAKDGIMIPIPQYPLYSASIALNGGSCVPYYLNEEKGWQLDISEAERSIEEARKEGKTVRSIVIINPGNPTGAIFSPETIEQIIRFAVKHRLIIIADEVYRENIYKQNAKFTSFRKVLNQLPAEVRDAAELVSLNSISKGFLGECGLRGGYMELHNINPDVHSELVKLKSIFLCSNSVGQCMVELMCNPPLENVDSSTKNEYVSERDALLASLKKRASLVTKALNKMKNIHCQEVEGAMYAFPTINFSKKAQEAAKGKSTDLFYCLELLEKTGIAVVPGSGFRQRPGTSHFRITTLILPQEKLQKKLEAFQKFNDEFHSKYA